jgi:predicted component of type VI protein secretion system
MILKNKINHDNFQKPFFEKFFETNIIEKKEIKQYGRPYKDFLSSINNDISYSKDSYIQSILKNIYEILHSRSGIKRNLYDILCEDDLNSGLPEMYGLPEFIFHIAYDSNENYIVCEIIERCIKWYEPRLKNVHIENLTISNGLQSFSFSINAELVDITNTTDEIYLPITVGTVK